MPQLIENTLNILEHDSQQLPLHISIFAAITILDYVYNIEGVNQNYLEVEKRLKTLINKMELPTRDGSAARLHLSLLYGEHTDKLTSEMDELLEQFNGSTEVEIKDFLMDNYIERGIYKEAVEINRQAKVFFQNEIAAHSIDVLMKVDDDFQYLQLMLGNIEQAHEQIENQLVPYFTNHLPDHWLASRLEKHCIPFSYHYSIQEIERYCKAPYFLAEGSLGTNNFWTEKLLAKLVWWFALQDETPEEKQYVSKLENAFQDNLNYYKIEKLNVLVRYYLNRANVDKATKYIGLLEAALTEYAADIYTVHQDSFAMYQAELAIQLNTPELAREYLSAIADSVCQYHPKNYLRMHLKQVEEKTKSNICK